MAVRFSATGQDYTRSLALGSQAQLSAALWMKISTDRNAFSAAWSVDNGTTAYFLGTDADGTTMNLWGAAASPMVSFAMTVGTWYYVAFSANGVNGTHVRRALGDTAFTTGTFSTGNTTTPCTTLRLGTNMFGEWLNGCIAAAKLWVGATLTQAELENECWSYLPQRTTGMTCWYPMVRAETVDYSGNSQTLSGGTGASTEDGPGVAWGHGQAMQAFTTAVAVSASSPPPNPIRRHIPLLVR